MDVAMPLPPPDSRFRNRLLNLLAGEPFAALYETAAGPVPVTGSTYGMLAAAGARHQIITSDFNELEAFLTAHRGSWVFGSLAYEVNNPLFNLEARNPDHTGFPAICFFVPEWVIAGTEDRLEMHAPEGAHLRVLHRLEAQPDSLSEAAVPGARITHMPDREIYLARVRSLLREIQLGNVYEVNYCHQVTGNVPVVHPQALYARLTAQAPAPFAAYFRSEAHHLVCASPERFVTRLGSRILSQPVKGTAPRSADPGTDAALRNALQHHPKERAENTMITDLVRNDLSRVALRGSVQVDEWCGVYAFPRVHQMISTISCNIADACTFADVVRAAFPMGSMTGAPKKSAMQLIESHEDFKRSLFSGTVGYIAPGGDFDFNVVIRSILVNAATGNFSASAGSAITALCDPVQEFNETWIKLSPQLEALGVAADQITGAHAE